MMALSAPTGLWTPRCSKREPMLCQRCAGPAAFMPLPQQQQAGRGPAAALPCAASYAPPSCSVRIGASSEAASCSRRVSHVPRAAASARGGDTPVSGGERREYYDFKDMPPLPLTVTRISVPSLGHVVVEKSNENNRAASLAIFYDVYKDDQYRSRLNRRSAMTALCMYDRDDVEAAENEKGVFPNIDLLQRIYKEGLDVEFVVEESATR